jgi:hypothetical protein
MALAVSPPSLLGLAGSPAPLPAEARRRRRCAPSGRSGSTGWLEAIGSRSCAAPFRVALRVADSGLARVLGDGRLSTRRRSRPLLAQAVAVALARTGNWRSQASPRNVAVEVDDLHAVEQRSGMVSATLAVARYDLAEVSSTSGSGRGRWFWAGSSTSSRAAEGSPRQSAPTLSTSSRGSPGSSSRRPRARQGVRGAPM